MNAKTTNKKQKQKGRRTTSLEEAVNLASLQVDVDVEIARGGGETGDGLDVCSQGIPKSEIST